MNTASERSLHSPSPDDSVGTSGGGSAHTDASHQSDPLRRARLREHDAWPRRRDLAGLAAVEFVDTRCDDGLYRTLRGWVIGDRVIRTRLTIARFWHCKARPLHP